MTAVPISGTAVVLISEQERKEDRRATLTESEVALLAEMLAEAGGNTEEVARRFE